jgi:predicted DNA binding CopG/RHH family protein
MQKNLGRKNSKIKDLPQGKLHRVADFLPPPEELIRSEEVTKITISVDTETIDFFKNFAKKNGVKYQRMMREVLRGYARKYGT